MDSERRLEVPDLVFFTLVILLAAFGLVMVYSASSVTALEKFGDSAFFLKRQAVFAVAGFVGMLLIMNTDYRKWVCKSGWLLGFSLVALAAVLLPGVGVKVGGATRWIGWGGARFQPSEFAKLACILYMTWALVRKGRNVTSFTYGLLPMFLVAGFVAGLLMRQPDFGNTVLLVAMTGVMLFLAGARVMYLLGVALLSAPLGYWAIMGEAYRRKRMLAFLNPWEDPGHTSYQIVQSFTAFFSGGFWGKGLGNGQEKLGYLPEMHTDFVASVIGEELGFVGIGCLIVVFAFLVYRGYRIALRAPDSMGFLLAAGCTSLLGLQAMLNLMVVTGLLPTKGLPLPFISHGGSAMACSFLCAGFVQSVASRAQLQGPLPDSPWLKEWGR